MVSGTLTDTGGRTLAGQTVEAFYASVHHGNVISVGLNCGHGAERMRLYIERLSAVAACAVSAHPNAGLPDNEGRYSETPEMMAATIEDYLSAGLLNIVADVVVQPLCTLQRLRQWRLNMHLVKFRNLKISFC